MSDPQPLPQEKRAARPQAGGGGAGDLPDAPGLRNLTFLAAGLSVAAVVLAVPALRDQGPGPAAPLVQAAPPVAAVQTAPAATAAPPNTPTHLASAPPPPAVHVPAAAQPPATQPLATHPSGPRQPAPEALASAAPQAEPTPQSNACLVDARLLRVPYPQGVVVGFEDRATSEARIRNTEANLGGVINPSYFADLRVRVKTPSGAIQILIVPANMSVKIGDRVTLQSGYRDMGMPCGYVPPLVTGDLGPAPQPPPATPGATPPGG